MTAPRLRVAVKGLFTALVIGSAFSDLLLLQPVRDSLVALGYPLYLGPLLGSLKLFGVLGIWQRRSAQLVGWSYAGFFFDHAGAFASNLLAGLPLVVDGVIAPLYLALTVGLARAELDWRRPVDSSST
jgi:hypothetical protein